MTKRASQSLGEGYRPDIDGLRAVAVVAVIAYHSGSGATGGYVGVDVFFVISGYLIASIIFRSLDQARFSLSDFWARRFRRIMPAQALMVLATLILGWKILLPADFRELGQSIIAQPFISANIYFYRESGYFAPAAETLPLLHTWSLAVEEQFYVLLPLLLAGLHRFGRRRVTGIISVLAVGSFAFSVYQVSRSQQAAFFLLPARAWELLIGVLLAIATTARNSPAPRWLNEALAWLGLTAILASAFGFDNETLFPGATALIPCLGAAALIQAGRERLTTAGRLLALRPLVFVGKMSYSLYLWHWPALAYAHYLAAEPIPPITMCLLLGVSFIAAFFSWRYIETPFRSGGIIASKRRTFSFAAATSCTLLLAGLFVHSSSGLPQRFTDDFLLCASSAEDRPFLDNVSLAEVESERFQRIGHLEDRSPPRLFVWGDSHAKSVLPAIADVCHRHRIPAAAAVYNATAPLLKFESTAPSSLKSQSPAYAKAVVGFIATQGVKDVLLVARWRGYCEGGEVRKVRKALELTIASLRTAGARVWLLQQVPEHQVHVPRAWRTAMLFGTPIDTIELPNSVHNDQAQLDRTLFAGLESRNVHVLDPSPWFYAPERESYMACKDGRLLYWDDQHLTPFGSRKLDPLFERIVVAVREGTASLDKTNASDVDYHTNNDRLFRTSRASSSPNQQPLSNRRDDLQPIGSN